MNKLIPIVVAVAIVVGSGAFYGGIQYAENKRSHEGFSQTDFQNLSSEERQQRFHLLIIPVSSEKNDSAALR